MCGGVGGWDSGEIEVSMAKYKVELLFKILLSFSNGLGGHFAVGIFLEIRL